MKKLPRPLIIIASLSLLALFVFPMWKIVLYAPQYPEGVEMHIWINKIGGTTPSTLQNINILNHYIGMKYIEPDSIPELKYFQYVAVAMVFLGLIAAWINRKYSIIGWTVLLMILCVLAMYDFYLWEYDYGHSLSDKAPIKIPGASFQPPLIGKKDIINFVALSLPHIAGYFIILSIALGATASWLKIKKS